jgi:hypothetical protein
MQRGLQTCFLSFLHYTTLAYQFLRKTWDEYQYPTLDIIRPHTQFFLSDPRKFSDSYDTVPEDAVYIEDWVEHGVKRSVIRYPGEAIPRVWSQSPFRKHPKTPWVWVGDRETEIDLTRTFNRFLIVGNRITSELVKKLINVTERTNLIYIESGTFKELKFPGGGLTIEEYDDRSISNRG